MAERDGSLTRNEQFVHSLRLATIPDTDQSAMPYKRKLTLHRFMLKALTPLNLFAPREQEIVTKHLLGEPEMV